MALRASCSTQKRHQTGFTIVELLIVVVVIAILAAITIVSYNGIQNRAKDTALQSDLRNASAAVHLASVDNSTPLTQLPASVKPSSGVVIALTDNTGYDGNFCVNGYQISRQKVMSYDGVSGAKEGLCPGKVIGTPSGGAIPATVFGVNLLRDSPNWQPTTGTGISYDKSANELKLTTNISGSYQSPLIRVSGSSSVTMKLSNYATIASGYYSPQQVSAIYSSSRYFGSDGTTLVNNSANYTSNGNAQAKPLNQWSEYSVSFLTGPNVEYIRFNLNSGTYTTDNILKGMQIFANP